MALYHKHRPQDFDEMAGNEATIASVKALIEKPDHPHAFLMQGPSGTGKTTIARLIAQKYLGADKWSLRELNTADNRGIDSARDIIETLQYASSGPLVFIIDEVHQTTKEWQNAMLKPLEDYPKHVYFFLCTTDPQKLIPAIKTRLTKVELSALRPAETYRLLRKIAKKEGWDHIPKEVLEEIADVSQGSPREALGLLEKVSGLTDAEEMSKAVGFGEEAGTESIELARQLLSGKGWAPVADVLSRLKTSEEPESVRRAVLGYMNAVLLKKDNARAALCMECFAAPFYDSGFPGLTLACYQVISGE